MWHRIRYSTPYKDSAIHFFYAENETKRLKYLQDFLSNENGTLIEIHPLYM